VSLIRPAHVRTTGAPDAASLSAMIFFPTTAQQQPEGVGLELLLLLLLLV